MPKVLDTWKVTQLKLPKVLDTWKVTQLKLPKVLDTWTVTQLKLPKVLDTWKVTQLKLTKVLDTWKVTQPYLLRQESVNCFLTVAGKYRLHSMASLVAFFRYMQVPCLNFKKKCTPL